MKKHRLLPRLPSKIQKLYFHTVFFNKRKTKNIFAGRPPIFDWQALQQTTILPACFSYSKNKIKKHSFQYSMGPLTILLHNINQTNTHFRVEFVRRAFEHRVSTHAVSLAGVCENNGPVVFASVKQMVCKRAPSPCLFLSYYSLIFSFHTTGSSKQHAAASKQTLHISKWAA